MNATFGALSANPQQFLQNFQSNPLAAWGLPIAGLAGAINPQAGNSAMTQLGYGSGALSGGAAPQPSNQSFSPTDFGQQALSQSMPAAQIAQQQMQTQPGSQHWDQLISLLMQRLDMGQGAFGSNSNLFGSSGNPNSGFIPTFNVSGIYSR